MLLTANCACLHGIIPRTTVTDLMISAFEYGRSWSLHSAATTEPTETGTIDLNHWYGALYYEAIATKWKHQTVYVLLG